MDIRELLDDHLLACIDRQLAFSEVIGSAAYSVDLHEGVVSFTGGPRLRVGLIGSAAPGPGTWLWAWANPTAYPAPVLQAVEAVRAFGQARGIRELVTPELPLDDAWDATRAGIATVATSDVRSVVDGDVVDLGSRSVTVLHLPGHTAGHCGFLVEPDGFLFLGDIDLTSFGPYYGDLGSDLDAFEASLNRLRDIDARWYGTAHQKGVVEGRDTFLRHLEEFAQVIRRREEALLAMLARPRTVAEIAQQRLVYRPAVALPFVDAVELRTAQLHLDRLVRSGRVREEDGRFRAVG